MNSGQARKYNVGKPEANGENPFVWGHRPRLDSTVSLLQQSSLSWIHPHVLPVASPPLPLHPAEGKGGERKGRAGKKERLLWEAGEKESTY